MVQHGDYENTTSDDINEIMKTAYQWPYKGRGEKKKINKHTVNGVSLLAELGQVHSGEFGL